MNERIEQLALQAGTTGVKQVWFTRPELKKFAELIVRECAMIVDSKLDFESASGPDDWASGEDVLKHFGIEE